MKALALGLFVVAASFTWRASAQAQTAAVPVDSKAEAAGPAAAGALKKEDDPTSALPAAGDATVPRRTGWDDIVVVPRKAVLKDGRLELMPFTGVSLNDVLIRHYAFGADLNYYLTDVLSVGVQGQYFIKERTDRESVVGLQYNRVTTLNKYKFAAALNFGYVPGYGKFTLFNRYILHWEIVASAGVGIIRTEIIPRVVGNETFQSDRLAPNVGLGTRFFLGNWLTFNVQLRDYMFNDAFEPTARTPAQTIDVVKANASHQFTNNVMLYAGVGIFFPTSFQYRTPR